MKEIIIFSDIFAIKYYVKKCIFEYWNNIHEFGTYIHKKYTKKNNNRV